MMNLGLNKEKRKEVRSLKGESLARRVKKCVNLIKKGE